MFVARDKDGEICLYPTKPFRSDSIGWSNECWDSHDGYITLPTDAFPELTWEDEPIEVELVKK